MIAKQIQFCRVRDVGGSAHYEPFAYPIPVPALLRDMKDMIDEEYAPVRMESVAFVLDLENGTPGPFRINVGTIYPTGQYVLQKHAASFVWPEGARTHRAIIDVPVLEVRFKEDGCFTYKFLADGEPIGEEPVCMAWDEAGSEWANLMR